MLKRYLLNNLDELEQLVTTINAYNGELEYLMVLENDNDFFITFFERNPMEAVRCAYYGDYRYNDDYVQFDGYENLRSYDEYQYKELLRNHVEEIINEFLEIKDECEWINEDLIELAEEEYY